MSARFDKSPSEEYEDCFDACSKQCRLSAKSGGKDVAPGAARLFDADSHPFAVQQRAGKYTGGPGQMVGFVGAPSASAARFAAGSASGAARAIDAPGYAPLAKANAATPAYGPRYASLVEPFVAPAPGGDPVRRDVAYWPKNSHHAASRARSGSQLAMAMGRDA